VCDDPSDERAFGIRSATRAGGRSMEKRMDPRHNGHHPRVLIVDDDDELAEVLHQTLRESGYAVATVRHGAAALELIGQIQPDLILLDLKMPIMDGWSFVSQYRRSGKASGRIVLLTGHPNVREISQSLGADAYIEKPFELIDLIGTIEQQLGAIG
jgi:two-component system chemotaxis response regulator CheY